MREGEMDFSTTTTQGQHIQTKGSQHTSETRTPAIPHSLQVHCLLTSQQNCDDRTHSTTLKELYIIILHLFLYCMFSQFTFLPKQQDQFKWKELHRKISCPFEIEHHIAINGRSTYHTSRISVIYSWQEETIHLLVQGYHCYRIKLN